MKLDKGAADFALYAFGWTDVSTELRRKRTRNLTTGIAAVAGQTALDTLIAGLLAGSGAGAASFSPAVGSKRSFIFFAGMTFVDMARKQVAGYTV